MVIPMNFDRIKLIREEKELTQMQMAEILNVKRSAYSLWEINKNVIPLVKLNKFCNIFSLSMDYITGLSDIKEYDLRYSELDTKDIGKRFKQARKELNFTQEKLAKIFNTTHSAISAYENGVTMIPTIFLIEFAKISNISLNWFCGKTDNQQIQ